MIKDWINKLISKENKGIEPSIKPTYQMVKEIQKAAPMPSNEGKTIESRVLSLELRFRELEELLTEKTPTGKVRLNAMGRRFRKW